MRTTVTLDDALIAEAKVLAVRTSRTVSSLLEEALRDLVARYERATGEEPALPLPICDLGGLQPGVDLLDGEQMAELLGDNTFAR